MAIPITKPYFSAESRKDILEGIDRVLSSGQLMLGEFNDKLETSFAQRVGMQHAITTNTCTTALMIALQYYDVKDAEVLVPAGSFLTDISAVAWSGGKAVLVDMNPETLSFDLDDLKRKITSKTKGIIWVHITGLISHEHEQIVQVAREHNLFLIEDCAHAHGAEADGRPAGSLGDVGCFSFFPTKVITAGTGGIMTTGDGKLNQYAREVRLLGRHIESADIVQIGNDWFLDEVRACVGYHQLKELESFLQTRRRAAERYRKALDGKRGFTLLHVPDGYKLSYYQYPIFLDEGIDRERLISSLKAKHGVSAKRIYLPTHQEVIFRDYDDGSLKKTEDTLNRSLCLPMFSNITDEDVDAVCHALMEEINNQA